MKRSIVFINSLFPCLSETFVFDQLQCLRAAGLSFVIASNHRPDDSRVHPRMRDIQSEVHYLCEARLPEIAAAHLRAFLRHPLRYSACLAGIPFGEEKARVSLAQFTGAALILHRFGDRPGLHLHAHFTYGAAGVALWAKRLGVAGYSLTLHGSDLIYDRPADLEAKLVEADAIVSISRFNVDFLRRHFPRVPAHRVAVIGMGIPPLPMPPPRPQRDGVLNILNVGRLSEHKAQHHLIDACALLAERGIAFRCDIVGDGDRRDFLAARIAQHGLQDRVHLLGPRFHDEVLALYARADLFVLCSITEGQPVVLMEAMRAGVPLVATTISAIPELVRDAGILVPPSEPAALADAIQSVAEGRVDTARMTTRAAEIIGEEYDLETNHRRFKEFLEQL